MILASVGFLGAYVAAWGGLGFPFVPVWWASLLAPVAWGVGIALRKRGGLTTGFYLLVGLASAAALYGTILPALAAVAAALWSWDVGTLWLARLDKGDSSATRRLARAAVVRSTWLNAAGLGVGLGFAALRAPIPFWGLVGGAVVAWVGLVLLVRALRRYSAGGEASGNRSSS